MMGRQTASGEVEGKGSRDCHGAEEPDYVLHFWKTHLPHPSVFLGPLPAACTLLPQGLLPRKPKLRQGCFGKV